LALGSSGVSLQRFASLADSATTGVDAGSTHVVCRAFRGAGSRVFGSLPHIHHLSGSVRHFPVPHGLPPLPGGTFREPDETAEPTEAGSCLPPDLCRDFSALFHRRDATTLRKRSQHPSSLEIHRVSPPSSLSNASTPGAPKHSFGARPATAGPLVPSSQFLTALTVSSASKRASLLHPATDLEVQHVSGFRVPTYRSTLGGRRHSRTATPLEEFPSTAAVPHHCGHSLPGVLSACPVSTPSWRKPRSIQQAEQPAPTCLHVGSAHARAYRQGSDPAQAQSPHVAERLDKCRDTDCRWKDKGPRPCTSSPASGSPSQHSRASATDESAHSAPQFERIIGKPTFIAFATPLHEWRSAPPRIPSATSGCPHVLSERGPEDNHLQGVAPRSSP
jgi:hypothetical protein